MNVILDSIPFTCMTKFILTCLLIFNVFDKSCDKNRKKNCIVCSKSGKTQFFDLPNNFVVDLNVFKRVIFFVFAQINDCNEKCT